MKGNDVLPCDRGQWHRRMRQVLFGSLGVITVALLGLARAGTATYAEGNDTGARSTTRCVSVPAPSPSVPAALPSVPVEKLRFVAQAVRPFDIRRGGPDAPRQSETL